ncbi:diacylglycerol kinase family lipid kinase [soil metagenome]
MKRKLLYFINPVSGTLKKSSVVEVIKAKTAFAGFAFEICESYASADYLFLRDKIQQEKITDVIICGGDGTINGIASHLINVDVNIGIIPCGSGNGLAFCAQIPKSPEKALDIILAGNSIRIDAFYINEHFSCMLCGIGFDAQVAHDFSRQKQRGLPTYIRQTLKNYFTAPLYPFTINIAGKDISTNAFLISIANSNQFGNNFTIAPKASLSDGLLDVVVVKKMNKIKMLWAVYRQLKFGELTPLEEAEGDKEILYFQVPELIISNPISAPFHIDGDPSVTAKEFRIRIIPAALSLLVS